MEEDSIGAYNFSLSPYVRSISSSYPPPPPLIKDIEDCLTIREIGAGTLSTNVIVSVLISISRLLNRPKLIPTRLKKKLGDKERLLPIVEHWLVEVEVKKDVKGMRVFYWVKNVPLLLELLVATTIQDGKKEDSFDFSNFVDTHIFVRGIDKGGEDVLDMVRYANRKDGNAGAFCVPISVLEDGSESHFNLAKTTLSKARSKVVEPLHQQMFQTFEIHFKDDAELSDLRNEVCCMLAQFTADDVSEFHPKNLSVTVDVTNDYLLVTKEGQTWFATGTEKATDREIVGIVKLRAHMLTSKDDGSFEVQLRLRLVRLRLVEQTDVDDSYIGCELYWKSPENAIDDVRLYAFMFAAPIVRDFNKCNLHENNIYKFG